MDSTPTHSQYQDNSEGSGPCVLELQGSYEYLEDTFYQDAQDLNTENTFHSYGNKTCYENSSGSMMDIGMDSGTTEA